MAPAVTAAPKAFGVSGSLWQMARNGALSGAALSGADAAVRGEDIAPAAGIGGFIGGAAGPVGKGVGKVIAAVADRFNPAAATPRNVVNVGGVDVPLSQSQLTQNPALSAEEQVLLRGGRGEPAQARAQSFKDLQDERVGQASDQIAAGLDPTGAAARTTPNEAAERVAAELIAQEQAQQAAAAGVHAGPMSPAQQGEDLARALGPAGSTTDQAERIAAELLSQEQARQAAEVANRAAVAHEGGDLARTLTGSRNVLAPFDAAESLSDRFAAARNAAKDDCRGKYAAVDAAPGEFAPGSAGGFGNDVQQGLRSAAVSLDRTNTPKALNALRVIDEHLNGVAPGQPRELPGVSPTHAQDVADIRAKFGDDVAAAYDRQKASADVPIMTQLPDGLTSITGVDWRNDIPGGRQSPKAQSLLEFIASKGGLGPDAELEAIGGHGHTVNVEGVGRRKLVRQGGWPLDYAREAAEEAGYLSGNHNGTSTVSDLLDAIDAEMRGQKRYPAGFEGHIGKREVVARSEREQHEFDAHMRGLEDDLAAAGHGELGPEVKSRAIRLMADEGMGADDAVERALHRLEQEDAARAAVRGSDFPGDRAPAAAAPQAGSGFTMRDVEQVRKQISTLYGDARRAMLGGGSGSDLHALEHIRDQFEARVEKMIAEGKFSGDGPAVLKMQQEARAAFADYKQKFAKRGAGDEVGAAVEKILGKFSDTKATPDTIVKLAYGSGSVPGGQMPVQIAQRIERIFGRNSEEFATYKQGLFAQLMAGEPENAAARIDEFLTGTKGRLLAQTVFGADERAGMAGYAERLRSTVPGEASPTPSANKILRDLMGANGAGTGVNAPATAQELKQRLSPEGWSRVKTMAFRELTQGDPADAAARMDAFLHSSNSNVLAQTMFSPGEQKSLAAYAERLRSNSAKIEPETGPAAAALRRYSGADGAPAVSSNKIVNDLMGATGKGNGVNAPLIASALKQRLSPEGWTSLRQGVWEKLTNAGEGKIQYEAQALSQRLHEFLNGSGSQLAGVLYSDQERALMKQLAAVYKQMIPVKGTTNPSGTAPMLARIANGARSSLLPLLGFNAGGLPGAAVALGVDKGLSKIANANQARKATELFFGEQPRPAVDPRFEQRAGLLSQGSLPTINQGRSR
ncbi:hypothetical protein [Bradyrhizobium sp. th.b2]|uniref:hypothetical protein n=1 Tax=Bradyrhizobium sp. th-b2 TaxID=172088 RepID=UPI0012ECB278|nr:hypothetical protein [Bradyrhizobium sp. th.b2]